MHGMAFWHWVAENEGVALASLLREVGDYVRKGEESAISELVPSETVLRKHNHREDAVSALKYDERYTCFGTFVIQRRCDL